MVGLGLISSHSIANMPQLDFLITSTHMLGLSNPEFLWHFMASKVDKKTERQQKACLLESFK